MKNSKLVNKITNAYVMLIYVFVFIPVIVMVAFSFNSLSSNHQGFLSYCKDKA
jgi:spermidine/putrescine transport system permease protein